MCDKLNTFIVDKESFVYAMEHGYGIINKYDYVEGSDNLLPNDFIVFKNNNNMILKRFWSMKHDGIEFISDFTVYNSDILLSLVCSIMYENIMWLRSLSNKCSHRRSTRIEIEERISIIEHCVFFLLGNINRKEFVDFFSNLLYSDCNFCSARTIVENFPYKPITRNRHVDNIIGAVRAMNRITRYKWKRKKISDIAYRIHNEPEKILEYC